MKPNYEEEQVNVDEEEPTYFEEEEPPIFDDEEQPNSYEEENEQGKKHISKTKLFRRVLAGVLAAGGIVLVAAGLNSCEKEEKNNNDKKSSKSNSEQDNNNYHVIDPSLTTTAIVNEDGQIELLEGENATTSVSQSEETTEKAQVPVVDRTVVTADDIKNIVESYYPYLNERIEDSTNNIDAGMLYSAAWLANSQFISTDETNSLIYDGLIPSDITTTKTEADNIMSVIISENASKVAVAQAFGTELDRTKLIRLDGLFIDDTDKKVAQYAYDEYIQLISTNLKVATYEDTRNFFNNCTQYDFNELDSDSVHFKHTYPVNFTQTSIGAQYLIKGIMGPQFVVYAASAGLISQEEANEFQNTINNVEGPMSYLDDKFNGTCFDNNHVKVYVK